MKYAINQTSDQILLVARATKQVLIHGHSLASAGLALEMQCRLAEKRTKQALCCTCVALLHYCPPQRNRWWWHG